MATQIGKFHLFGLSVLSIGISSLSGYVSPNVSGGSLGHDSDIDTIKGLTGEVTGLISSGDSLSCEFNIIPEGSSLANAKLACGIPASLAGISITGLEVIACGPFTDAFNTNVSTQPWIYQGGGRINYSSSEKWTATLPCKRYVGITSATVL